MFRKYGWAAFLASVTTITVFSAGQASAAAPRPTFACFKPYNATLIGRLGPNDGSVREAFDAGACMALPAGVVVTDAQHSGGMWSFHTLGSPSQLFAADWAAGFTGSGDDQRISAFSQFLPVTGRLLESGYGYADCYDATVKFSERWRDLDRRWREYQARGGLHATTIATTKVVIYVSNEGPKLAAEGDALRQEGDRLDRRCARFEAVVTDSDFIAFIRSTRRA